MESIPNMVYELQFLDRDSAIVFLQREQAYC